MTTEIGRETDGIAVAGLTGTPVIAIPAVARRLERRGLREKVTSDGTIAAGVMVVAAVAAIIVANSPAYGAVSSFLQTPLTLGVGSFSASLTVEGFVNDFLMAIFFLLVGIELKYEMTVGQLRQPRQAALPILAAVGGVMGPCIIYALLNMGGTHMDGWAVPMATDIAFALGVMSLLGDAVAPATKVFFSTLAIADDLLAIVVLALFYGQSPDPVWLAASAACVGALVLLGRLHVYKARYYLLVGLVLWVCMFNSGVHATLAGVILAFCLPVRSELVLDSVTDWLGERAGELDESYDEGKHVLGQHDFTASAARVERVMHHVTPPLQRVENAISVPVNFVILPLFAFVNAQVCLAGVDLGALVGDSVTRGVYLGALLGKPLGIIGMVALLVAVGFARLPHGMDWRQVVGVGLMGGMGFTMSILISGLAFTDPNEILAAKCAILAGSVTSALVGSAFIKLSSKASGDGRGRAV
ncbi:MAG: Na+/H+ antiporter NhaA [Atopobiaceae bacterium]|nr:Na+/H+ antiporter NhaA [Atopobiaceae bacterium]MCI2172727.1 Na+/H+ antiporter NhaA [Atopobiaceae bacterium]MCI2207034.1 Na+/H+ antiporter NhaA [Atopobiaceae bacterium]